MLCYPAQIIAKNFFSKAFFTLAIPGFIVTALLATGCGDDGRSGASGSETITVETGSLTKTKFIEQADAICKEGGEEIQEKLFPYLEARSKEPSSKDLLETHAAEIVNTIAIPRFEEEIDRIGKLGAPSGDEQEVAAILTAMHQVLEGAAEQPKAFMRSGASFGKAAKLARAYGLTACAPS